MAVSEVELSWESTVVGQSQTSNNVSMEAEDIVGICHQETTGEDTAEKT
jgi:hypothetical protein